MIFIDIDIRYRIALLRMFILSELVLLFEGKKRETLLSLKRLELAQKYKNIQIVSLGLQRYFFKKQTFLTSFRLILIVWCFGFQRVYRLQVESLKGTHFSIAGREF